jgi:methyltransferase-like protein
MYDKVDIRCQMSDVGIESKVSKNKALRLITKRTFENYSRPIQLQGTADEMSRELEKYSPETIGEVLKAIGIYMSRRHHRF